MNVVLIQIKKKFIEKYQIPISSLE